MDEIIGGNMGRVVHPTEGPDKPDYSIQSSTVTVDNVGNVQYIIGGQKAANANGIYNLDSASLTINGGSGLGTSGLVIGGNYFKATNNAGGGPGTASGTVNRVNVQVNGGTFGSTLIGAGVADDYRSDTSKEGVPDLNLTVNQVSTVITSGNFSTIGKLNKKDLGGVIIRGFSKIRYGPLLNRGSGGLIFSRSHSTV